MMGITFGGEELDEEERLPPPPAPLPCLAKDLEDVLVVLAQRRHLAWTTEVSRSDMTAEHPLLRHVSKKTLVLPAIAFAPDSVCWLRSRVEAALLVASWPETTEAASTIVMRALQMNQPEELEAAWRLGGDVAVGAMVTADWHADDAPPKTRRRRKNPVPSP